MKQSFAGHIFTTVACSYHHNILFVRFPIKWKLTGEQITFLFTFYSASFREQLWLSICCLTKDIISYFFLFSPYDFSWSTGIETSCSRVVSLQREPCESSLSRWHSRVKVERKKNSERRALEFFTVKIRGQARLHGCVTQCSDQKSFCLP